MNTPLSTVEPQKPSILDYLPNTIKVKAFYLKPALGKELTELNENPFRVMLFRSLKLREDYCVPLHWHKEKEKIYIQKSGAINVFLTGIDKSFSRKTLCEGDYLVIPPQTLHGIHVAFTASPNVEKTETWIVVSNRNHEDIFWEDQADALCLNTHRLLISEVI